MTWVSASDAGRAAFCPHYLELKNKKTIVSNEAKAARIKGEQKHLKFNDMAQEDTRCFVASYLYGTFDHRTCLLRKFRDDTLSKTKMGNTFIRAYYKLSPYLVRIATHSIAVHWVLKVSTFLVIKVISINKWWLKK